MSKFIRPRLSPPKPTERPKIRSDPVSRKEEKKPKSKAKAKPQAKPKPETKPKKKSAAKPTSVAVEGKKPKVKVERGASELADAITKPASSPTAATPEFASVLKQSEKKKLKDITWPKMARPGVPGPTIQYYIGDEVEVTGHFGMPTLFVVGAPPSAEEIIAEAKKHKIRNREVCHIRLGANESFDRNIVAAFKERVQELLTVGLCVTLDVPFVDVALLHPFPAIQQAERFVLAITMPWPGIRSLIGGQAVLRLSDSAFLGENGGIWITRLEDLTREGYFSNWRWYAHDVVIR